ncbi:carbohydrate sulfotransferase 1-like [Dermacentor variabilis]|uniref:carbohydrate sulfotransferase 1-like n=1 Tax=Dermacentor variabilis TaxID=34621 RepID=UPI003F5B00A4
MLILPRLWVRLLPRAALGSLVALSCIALIGQLSPIISYHTQNLAIYVNRGSQSAGIESRRRIATKRAYRGAEPVELPLALFPQEDTEGDILRRELNNVAAKTEKRSRVASAQTGVSENSTVPHILDSLTKAPAVRTPHLDYADVMLRPPGISKLPPITSLRRVSKPLAKVDIRRNSSIVQRNHTSVKAKVVPDRVAEARGNKPGANETVLPKIPDNYVIVDPAKKKLILLLAYFRSGSSFLGGLLSSASNMTFFSYEPLSLLSTAERLDPQNAPRGLEILANHLTCQFPRMSDYLAVAPKRWNHYAPNSFLMRLCGRKVKVCLNPEFMADVCRRSPVQVAKVTRLSVVQVLHWLRLNAPLRGSLKVVYLVRDPRGMISSRNFMSWCRKSAVCSKAKNLCREMEEDLDAFEELRELLPEATVRVRYEDIAKRPINESMALFRALGLEFSAGVTEFLRTHTVVNDTKVLRNPYSTVRRSSATAFMWTKKLNWDRVNEIQTACAPILTRLGYKVFRNQEELKNVSLS